MLAEGFSPAAAVGALRSPPYAACLQNVQHIHHPTPPVNLTRWAISPTLIGLGR